MDEDSTIGVDLGLSDGRVGSRCLGSESDSPSELVRLGGVLERRKNVRLGSTFDTVDEVGDFREERVVVSELMSLLVVISGSSDVERRSLVRVDKPHVVSIGPDFQLTGVSGTLQSDSVGERSNSAIGVLPNGTGDSRNSLLLGDLALVDGNLGQLTRSLVELDRFGDDGWDVDITTKVSRQVTEVGTLLNDGSHVDGLVPPSGLGDSLVSGRVSSVGGHDSEVVVVDDLLHQLDTSEVSQHVADGNDVAVLDEGFGNVLSALDLTSTDGLLDEVGDLGEELEEGELEVGALGGTTSVSGRTSHNDGVWVLLTCLLEVGVVIFNGPETRSVPVCRLDE